MPVTVRRASLVVLCGGAILGLALGIRQTFGLVLEPATGDLGLGHGVFGLAVALQNVLWGLAVPFAGTIADRFGAGRVLAFGAAAYTAGLLVAAGAGDAAGLHVGLGLLVGLGLAATSFPVVLGAVARAVPPERRGRALGLAAAGGSFGQFAVVPLGHALIGAFGWAGALVVMAVLAALMAPLAAGCATRAGTGPVEGPALGPALRAATGDRSYWLLAAGFCVCGFQVVLVAVHLPAFLADRGHAPIVGATALTLIGLFNILGTYGAGVLGDRVRKSRVLVAVYLARAGLLGLLALVPLGEAAVMALAAGLGLLWLGTVPLTSGVVSQLFGARHLGMLFGLVFLSHQVGSFLGAWAGGAVFDALGAYEPVWLAAALLGVAAAVLHWPVDDRVRRDAVPAAV